MDQWVKAVSCTVLLADYQNPLHQSALLDLLDEYARDPMGGGEGLADRVKEKLNQALDDCPGAFSILAFVDEQPAGLANCFETLSTFQCKPLVNIHDIVVSKPFRGLGISQRMLDYVEQIARQKDCCKLTLEVLEGNHVAQNAYRKFGFAGYELDPEQGKALFWEKKLS